MSPPPGFRAQGEEGKEKFTGEKRRYMVSSSLWFEI